MAVPQARAQSGPASLLARLLRSPPPGAAGRPGLPHARAAPGDHAEDEATICAPNQLKIFSVVEAGLNAVDLRAVRGRPGELVEGLDGARGGPRRSRGG